MKSKQKIEEVVRAIDKMPSLSPTVTKILEIANDPKASPRDLNTVISMDPVLTARILKLVNSAYFALSQQITQILRAIILLGLNTVKNLALSTAVLSRFTGAKKISSGFDVHEFWMHSLGVAVISKRIAIESGVDKTILEEYFIAGLLHDIGKIVFEEYFTEDLRHVLGICRGRGIAMAEAETAVIGVTHAEVGKWLTDKWGLSRNLIEVVELHHEPLSARESPKLVSIVALANQIAKAQEIGKSGNEVVSPVPEALFSVIGIPRSAILPMIPKVHEEIERASAFLQIG